MNTGSLSLPRVWTLQADERLNRDLFTELTASFTAGHSKPQWQNGLPNTIAFGTTVSPQLNESDEYVLNIDENGFCVAAQDSSALARGFCALLLRLEAVSDGYLLPFGTVHGAFRLKNRMAHLCVFPENSFAEIRKWLRLFGVLQYTHLVLEFWGTCPLDCFPEYVWRDHALSKDEIRLLVAEGKALGMQMIPMLNHLGHATGSRMRAGKHVLLDFHPEFESYFTPDGWAWNMDNPKVSSRLTAIRRELYELFDQPKYFHLGLDEAYIYHHGYASAEKVASYIGALVDRVLSDGVTPMLWADMLIPTSASQTVGHINNCCQTDTAADIMLRAISKKAILCDWQYEAAEVPIEPSVFLKERGYSVVGCCWYKPGNINAYVQTAISESLTGAMLTTWHTLQSNAKSILHFARQCGIPEPDWWQFAPENSITATVIRKSRAYSRRYEDTGFAPNQLAPILA